MEQYISKSALVAEIKRRRDTALTRQKNLESIGQETVLNEMVANELNRILFFINTLEVKDVDLEKESLTWEDMMIIHKHIKDAMNFRLYAFGTLEGQQKVYEDVLRRFKAQL